MVVTESVIVTKKNAYSPMVEVGLRISSCFIRVFSPVDTLHTRFVTVLFVFKYNNNHNPPKGIPGRMLCCDRSDTNKCTSLRLRLEIHQVCTLPGVDY